MSGRFSRFLAMCLVLGLAVASIMFMVFLLEEVGPAGFEWALIGMTGLGGLGWLIFRGPVGKALAGMLEGHGLPDGDTAQLLDDLHLRVAQLEQRGLTSGEVEQAYHRISEVESRLDFTERLLTQSSVRTPGTGEGA